MSFVVPFTKRVRAVAELGLRHFARCKQLVDWLEAEAVRSGDVFLELEARLIRARLFIAQGLASRGARVLEPPPKRFPWEGERGEYLATRGLAYACAGESTLALELADASLRISETVEVRVLAACISAIAAIQNRTCHASDRAVEAFQTALDVGSVDTFVIAYRGFPDLLASLASALTLHETLTEVIDRAHDWPLARLHRLDSTPSGPTRSSLSHREEEVLGLISQGLTNRQIAATLFISEATAKVHVRHIFDKLGVHTRTEAALRASMDSREEGF